MISKIKLERLCKIHTPWESVIWEHVETPITMSEVSDALEREDTLAPDGVLDAAPRCSRCLRSEHVRRIAYLVKNKTDDPISVDVGVPSLGYRPHWVIQDGNHRVLAAVYRGDETIDAYVSGAESEINWLCGK